MLQEKKCSFFSIPNKLHTFRVAGTAFITRKKEIRNSFKKKKIIAITRNLDV